MWLIDILVSPIDKNVTRVTVELPYSHVIIIVYSPIIIGIIFLQDESNLLTRFLN